MTTPWRTLLTALATLRLTFADRAPTPWVRQIIPANENLLDRPL